MKKAYKILITLTALIIISFFFFSCRKNKMYSDYKSFSKGYDKAKTGDKPSFWSNDAEKEGYKVGQNDLQETSSHSSITTGFQYTEKEIQDLKNRWESFEQMVSDAFKGDKEAMFSVGLSYLYGGKGLAIDINKANMFFKKAASLGHAPSMEKIRAMYLEDDPNPFLHQVYLNLIIALGHTEYTSEYHRVRSEWIKKLDQIGGNGKSVMEEIEKIAEAKLNQVYENIDNLNAAQKEGNIPHTFFLQLNDITSLDTHLYNFSYWLSISGISQDTPDE